MKFSSRFTSEKAEIRSETQHPKVNETSLKKNKVIYLIMMYMKQAVKRLTHRPESLEDNLKR